MDNWMGLVFIAFALCSGMLLTLLLEAPVRTVWNRYLEILRGYFDVLALRTSPLRFATIHLAVGVCMGIVCALNLGVLGGCLAFLFVAIMPFWMFPLRKQERIRAFELQLPASLRAVANGLKVGLVLPRALGLVEQNMNAPSQEEFGLILRRYELGEHIDSALLSMGVRIKSTTLELALTAMLIGKRAGGNLPQILETTASTIEQIQTLEEKIRVATSQGKLQGLMVGFMPLVFGVLVYFIDPSLILPLFQDPVGWMVLAGIVLCELIGLFLMREILSKQV